jgi:hypothetical protein
MKGYPLNEMEKEKEVSRKWTHFKIGEQNEMTYRIL